MLKKTFSILRFQQNFKISKIFYQIHLNSCFFFLFINQYPNLFVVKAFSFCNDIFYFFFNLVVDILLNKFLNDSLSWVLILKFILNFVLFNFCKILFYLIIYVNYNG